MNIKEILKYKNFVVVGDTLNDSKYAYKIKNALLEKGYKVECVGKELKSINDSTLDIDVIDLCINPIKGLEFIKSNKKPFKYIVIQPGAESDELLEYLTKQNIPFLQSCVLAGLDLLHSV